MEWIRIKPKHILNNGLSKTEKCGLIEIQCLTAYLERLPTEKELSKIVSKNTLKHIKDHLTLHQLSINFVLNKVMEDVEKAKQTRLHWKNKKAEQREKIKVVHQDVPQDVPQDTDGYVPLDVPDIDKIRLDKIRKREGERFAPPSQLEVKEYWESQLLKGDPEEYFNYFTSKGWVIGEKAKMKDWKHAARNWSIRENKFNAGGAKDDRRKYRIV